MVKFKIFPYDFLLNAYNGYKYLKSELGFGHKWYMKPYKGQKEVNIYDNEKLAPGLTLVTSLSEQEHPHAKIIDRYGNIVHSWSINWFELWPDETHIPKKHKYLSPPGPHIHGVKLMENGDLVFNMERAGMFRLSPCGEIVWRLPRITHHALHIDEDNNIWAPALNWGDKVEPLLYAHKPEFKDFKLLKISPDGNILKEWRLFDILRENGLTSLLYMGSQNNGLPVVTGDTLHFNDVKTYPRSMEQGFFQSGDIMLSLRNVNAILVFDADMHFKHIFLGSFVRQHDPDFESANTITVFDNFNHTTGSKAQRSRIIQLSTQSNNEEVLFEGNQKHPFFTSIMGKHQKLSNGNYLITESTQGRAFEIQGDKIIWEYHNIVGDRIGLMDEAQRLPVHFTKDFFKEKQANCKKI